MVLADIQGECKHDPSLLSRFIGIKIGTYMLHHASAREKLVLFDVMTHTLDG